MLELCIRSDQCIDKINIKSENVLYFNDNFCNTITNEICTSKYKGKTSNTYVLHDDNKSE